MGSSWGGGCHGDGNPDIEDMVIFGFLVVLQANSRRRHMELVLRLSLLFGEAEGWGRAGCRMEQARPCFTSLCPRQAWGSWSSG